MEGGADMNPMPSSGETPAASLVGSISAFHVAEVLTLLARTSQSGELQVVGNAFDGSGIDGRLWLETGELAGSSVKNAQTMTQAVFELALLDQGWFYFTEGRKSPFPAEKQKVDSALEVVGPQVKEWHDLLQRVPLDAVIRLSPTPPGSEVQIRGEQWQILTTLGSADMSVHDVVAALEHDHVVTLRLLRDLVEAGLVIVVPKDGEAPVADEAPSPLQASVQGPVLGSVQGPQTPWPSASSTSAPNTPFASQGGDGLEESSDLPTMPPPISADPWAHAASDNNGAHSQGDTAPLP